MQGRCPKSHTEKVGVRGVPQKSQCQGVGRNSTLLSCSHRTASWGLCQALCLALWLLPTGVSHWLNSLSSQKLIFFIYEIS